MSLLLLAAASDSVACWPRAPAASAPYDSAVATSLAGQYELTLVAPSPRPSAHATGRLELLLADAAYQVTAAPLSGTGPRRRGLARPLWGTAALTGDLLADFSAFAVRDPEDPAVALLADGRLLLRGERPTAFHLELRIVRVGPRGFWGQWVERHGLPVVVGQARSPREGYFCATR